jgi:hypothetical protein
MNNNNNRYVVLKPLSIPTFENLIKREGSSAGVITNKVPQASHYFQPAFDRHTWSFLVDTSYLDYEMLGIEIHKPDTPYIANLMMQKAVTQENFYKTYEEELIKLKSTIVSLETDLDDKANLIKKIDRDLADNEKALDLELKKEKRNEAKVTGYKEKKEALTEQRLLVFSDWQYIKDQIESKNKKEKELIAESKLTNANILRSEAEIVKARAENVYTEKELQNRVAQIFRSNANATLDIFDSPESVWKNVPPIKLDNQDLTFDKADIKQALQLCAIMGSGLVAKSNRISDTLGGKYEYYIYDNKTEIQMNISTEKVKETAYNTKVQLSIDTMRDIITMNGYMAYGMSEQDIEAAIYSLINKDAAKFIQQANLENTARVQKKTVTELITYNIVVKNNDGQGYKIANTNQILPVQSFDDLVIFLHGSNNKETMLKSLIIELENKKGQLKNTHSFNY